LLVTLTSFILRAPLTAGAEIREVSIENLYKNGVIDTEQLMSDAFYYLRSMKGSPDKLYLKRGRENKPFLLDIQNLKVNAASEEDWNKAQHETAVEATYHKTGDFLEDNGDLKNIYTKQIIKPFGKHILEYSISPSGQHMYVYSLSGYYKRGRGIGWIAGSTRKMGMNCFEIFNLKTRERLFLTKRLSFSNGYWPQLLFWLEDRRLMIFSNEYDKSLMTINY